MSTKEEKRKRGKERNSRAEEKRVGSNALSPRPGYFPFNGIPDVKRR
jgi:hypothetical protein